MENGKGCPVQLFLGIPTDMMTSLRSHVYLDRMIYLPDRQLMNA
jgi:hypothetical protein